MVRAAAIAASLFLAASAPAVPCSVPVGATVMLKSADIDPDVFVWDAKHRAVDYAAGYWRSTQEVVDHTALAKPGTRAVVIACDPAIVHSRFTRASEDAVGIRLLSGVFRGRYGWVTSDDIHALSAPTAAAQPR